MALTAVLALTGYDLVVRPRLLDWGSTRAERAMPLPGDSIVAEEATRHTRAVAIAAPPAAVWPWLVQIGDHRGGFYSYDWVERATAGHFAEDGRSATRIHPELQDVHPGERIGTGSLRTLLRIDAPVTVVEPGRALVIGTWAFVLERTLGNRTRLLVRQPYTGWLRTAVPARFAMLRALAGVVDYAVGEPLHFVMERKMLLGLKQRAEQAAKEPQMPPAPVP